MTFLTPWYLLALAFLPLLLVFPRQVRLDVGHAALRCTVLLALILGLAQPVLRDTDATQHHVFVVDSSTSVRRGGALPDPQKIRRILEKIEAPKAITIVEVAPEATNEQTIAEERRAAFEGLDPAAYVAMRNSASSISTALEVALAQIPAAAPGAVTLISDGLATDTHWGPVLGDFAERGVPLHSIALPSQDDEPRIVGMRADRRILVGQEAKLRARVAGKSAAATLSLYDGEQLLSQRGPFAIDGRRELVLRFEAREAGFRDLELRLQTNRGSDRDATKSWRRCVAVQRRLRLLYLGGRMRGAATELEKLVGKSFEILEDDGTQTLPQDLDVIMLDDRPAAQLPDAMQEAIARAVRRDGAGLFASGGRAAFAAGGYHKSVIEELLPVDFVQKEEKKDPSTTLAIIIDSSGSMVGNRMTLAKQVARLAMRRLQPHDKVGIVEFYGTKSWAAPIQSAANQIDLQRALNRLDAGGGTVLMPAIEEAYYAMKNVQTRYKHVLVLTDAGVETGDYESLLRRMSDEGMAVSTVLVGPGRHSDFLVDLADWGGGRYYNATDRFHLPELLLKKPSTSILPSYRAETRRVEVRGGQGWFGPIDMSTLPPIDAYVECELRAGAQSLMTIQADKPLLATKLSGLGRACAFLSEVTGPGTRQWSAWSDYGRFLSRILARTARGHQPPFDTVVERRRGRVRVVVKRLTRSSDRPLCQVVHRDTKAMRALEMQESAPGIFEHRLTWAADEDFYVRVSARARPRSASLHVSPARDDVAPERQVDPSRAFPLRAASAATGGQHFASLDAELELGASRAKEPSGILRLWPWCLLASLLLFLADIYYRRRRAAAPRFVTRMSSELPA